MMPKDNGTLFPESAAIEAGAASVEARLPWMNVPAKCAVYLLTGGEGGDKPLLLATVGNLRAALQRRLADTPPEVHTKRIQYGQICTRVHWRIVHSPFAANWWYWQSARMLFPDRYKELIAWQPAWWIALDKGAEFPKLRRIQDLSDGAMDYAGPIRDRTAAGKVIDTVEDMFDLCRYHHILMQAPHGKACAYKEMGKCPAPCDGSVPLEWFHAQIRAAFRYIRDEGGFREKWRAGEISQMKSAAERLAFEQAARVKQRIERANLLTAESYEHMGRLEDFAFLSLQPGHGRTNIEPWLIHGGSVECLPQFKKKDIGTATEILFDLMRERIAAPLAAPIDAAGTEQIGIVAHHLFRAERDAGVYLRMRDIERGGADWIVQRAVEWLQRKTAVPGVGGTCER